MDWRMHRDLVTGRVSLPAWYTPPRQRVTVNEEVVRAALAWVEDNLSTAFWEDRPDWVWYFEFAAAEVRIAYAHAKERADKAETSLCAWKQLALCTMLRRRAERLRVDVKQLVDTYVRFHRAIGVWEPELLILHAAFER